MAFLSSSNQLKELKVKKRFFDSLMCQGSAVGPSDVWTVDDFEARQGFQAGQRKKQMPLAKGIKKTWGEMRAFSNFDFVGLVERSQSRKIKKAILKKEFK